MSCPDGRLLAFDRFLGSGHGAYELFVAAADGTRIRNIPRSAAEERQPDWSPNGQLIVFARYDPDAPSGLVDIYALHPDGNGVELYRDRPEEEWPRPADGEGVAMYNAPLDLEALLAEATPG